MKVSDVVTQLQVRLPQLTDKFTTDVSIASITRSSTVMTAICNGKHGLKTGSAVAIEGAIAPIPITSLTRSGVVGTLATTTDHDLTEPIAPTITISGATEAEFNGEFTRLAVSNRKTITFTMADSGATTATGSPVLENAESALRNYNGTFQVDSVPNENTFTYTHAVTNLPDPIGTITARVNPRISAAINIDRAAAGYTSQPVNKYWLFVVIESVDASKSRQIASDATDNLQRGNFFRQQILQPFTLYVFIPVTREIAARGSRDLAEELFQPLCQAVLFHQFDSQLDVGAQGPVQFVTHGVFSYDTALYVHAYSFEQVVDLSFDDTVGPFEDVAFRDIDLTIFPDVGGGTGISFVDIDIDLDDVPL